MRSSGNLTLQETTVSGGKADAGGGIYSRGVLTLNDSIITGNSADRRGGGINNVNSSSVSVNDSMITGNFARDEGGGVGSGSSAAITTLSDSTITGNSAGIRGGGVFNAFSPLTLIRTLVSGNTASSGGEVYNLSGSSLPTILISLGLMATPE